VYNYVPRSQIIEVLTHLRGLLRQIEPTNDRERLAAERREIVAKYIISNLPKTGEHPTLNTLMEVAETFRLTIGAAHELFGYDLEAIRKHDLRWNAGRTHIIESYVFDRNRLVDIPLVLAPEGAFQSDAMVADLVREWQSPVPIRALDAKLRGWPKAFYVHVGTEDSYGTSLPPGSMALVDTINQAEALRPNPRFIYLLQFGNGYKCSRCVVTRGKLHILTSARTYARTREFSCPGEVRVAGRVRMFAHALPQPEYKIQDLVRSGRSLADLILPWEQRTRGHLLLTKHRRFRRPKQQEEEMREELKELLRSPLSGRTERRYRHPGSSEPHVSTLIQLTLSHFARYSDSLRGSGPPITDRGRYSLATMLDARNADELLAQTHTVRAANDLWNAQRPEFVDWLPLVSFKFPNLKLQKDLVVRLAQTCSLQGIEPVMAAGSWMLLEPVDGPPDTTKWYGKNGWARPLYVLRQSLQLLTGYLEREGSEYVLLSDTGSKVLFGPNEVSSLHRVAGVVVPV
jgi:hypothetical protein